MSDNLITSKYTLLIVTILSITMMAASIVPSFFSTTAFAASDNDDVVVDPTVQTSVEADPNVNVDPDVEVAKGCVEISDNDEVTQVNEQSANQEVHKNNDVGDGGVVVEPTAQASIQIAANFNVDDDVIIILGCNDGGAKVTDNDEVTQVNEQSANQEIDSDSEVGDGGVLFSQVIQKSRQTAVNYNADKDVFIVLGCNDENVEITDNDEVTQVNEQSANQEVDRNSDVGDGGVLFSQVIQKSRQTAVNYGQDNDRPVLVPLPNL